MESLPCLLRETANEIKMKTMWIKQALNAGGLMKVGQAIPNKSIFRAVMEWPNEHPVSGKVSTSLEGALENLNEALMEDCADEMALKGQV